MADKQLAALERLTGKLTALRKTLRGEERALLDKMVLSLSAEVTPHGSKADSKTLEGKTAGKTAGKVARYNLEADEVAVHSSRVEKHNADAKTSTKQMRSTPNAAVSEVDMHSLNVDKHNADSKTMTKQMRSTPNSVVSGKQMRSTPNAAASEIELHAMKMDRQTAESKTAGKQAGAVARITVNERAGVYSITID